MNIVNLTPHSISILDASGEPRVIPPSGNIARVKTESREVARENGIQFFRSVKGEVMGLPAPCFCTVFLVSAMVREAVRFRSDVVSPGELVRDDKGNPIGCKGLVIN
jgi:hypothetical protein